MNNNPTIKPEFIPNPFTRFCMTIGYIPSSYLDSLDYMEQVLWLIKFLQEKVIPAVDNNAGAVEELQALYIQLKDYVEHYFDNLDVQEEINNKLDEMVEDGTLQEIISMYLNSTALWCFDSVTDMQSATNLIDGSYAKTIGYYSPNDGGQGIYQIKTKTNSDVEDGGSKIFIGDELVAHLIPDENVNIKQFGATGDGITNDTSYIQNAINYVESNQLINTILIPKGTYVISHLEITESINIIGYSSFYSTLKSIDNNNNNSLIEIINTGGFHNIFSNFRLYGNKDNNSNTIHGILGNITQSNLGDRFTRFENLEISSFTGCGILLNDNLTNYDFREIRIDNVNVSSCKKGIYAKGVTDSIFTKITAHSNVEEGIYISSANNRIINCKCFWNGRGDEETIEELYRIPSDAFTETTDESPVSGKTYYIRSGSNYQNDWYQFTEFTGSIFEPDVTYYEMTTNYYKRYAGFVINGVRCVISDCEAQDNFGDGIQILSSYNSVNNVSCDNNGLLIPPGQSGAAENVVSYASQNMSPLYCGVYIYRLTNCLVTGNFNNHRYNSVGPQQKCAVMFVRSNYLTGDVIAGLQADDIIYLQSSSIINTTIKLNSKLFEYNYPLSNISAGNNITLYDDSFNGCYFKVSNHMVYYNLMIDDNNGAIVPSDSSNRILFTIPANVRPLKLLHKAAVFTSNHGYNIISSMNGMVNFSPNGGVELRANYVENCKSITLNGSYPI